MRIHLNRLVEGSFQLLQQLGVVHRKQHFKMFQIRKNNKQRNLRRMKVIRRINSMSMCEISCNLLRSHQILFSVFRLRIIRSNSLSTQRNSAYCTLRSSVPIARRVSLRMEMAWTKMLLMQQGNSKMMRRNTMRSFRNQVMEMVKEEENSLDLCLLEVIRNSKSIL